MMGAIPVDATGMEMDIVPAYGAWAGTLNLAMYGWGQALDCRRLPTNAAAITKDRGWCWRTRRHNDVWVNKRKREEKDASV